MRQVPVDETLRPLWVDDESELEEEDELARLETEAPGDEVAYEMLMTPLLETDEDLPI